MVLFDISGQVLRANSVFASLSGYGPEELPGMHYLDFILAGKKESSAEVFRKLASGEITHFQAHRQYARKNGDILEVKITISVAPGQDGKPGYIIGMVEDITEMIRSEKIRQILFNISSAVHSSKDLSELTAIIQQELGKIIDTSNFFLALYNREDDSLSLPYFADDQDHFEVFPAGKTISSYVIETGKPLLLREEDMNRLEEEGRIDLVGSRSRIWMGVPLMVRDEIIGLIGIQSYRDENAYTPEDLGMMEFISGQISLAIERKKTEDELKVERVYFKQIFENSPEAIVIGDRHGNIKNINQGFTQLFGYSKEECLGRNINDLITPEAYINESVSLREIIGRNELFLINSVRKKKDGGLLDVSILGSPFVVNNENLTCVIYRDISEQKHTEEKLRLSKEKAEESDRLKTAFLANMSHEIRTPMNAIIGFTELLSVPNLPDEDKDDYITVIKSSGNILLKLIDDIIDLAKIEADQIRVEISRFPLNQLIKEIQTFYSEEILNLDRKDIDLIFEPSENDDFMISSDPFRLKQILNNLVGNAIKFTNRGFVKIRYTRAGKDKVRFTVEDTGIGIPEDKHDLIFNRFLQVDNSGTRKYGGTGLGLTISKKLVELLGGEIGLESSPGKGSAFSFTIRATMEAPEKNESALEDMELTEAMLAGHKMLVVEDNDANFQLIHEILRKSGAEILWAEDANIAFELLKQHPDIALILMDVQMPGMNGYDASRIIQKSHPEIPIIAQTAYAMAGEKEKAREAGCVDYLSKPIKPSQLVAMVHKYIHADQS